MQPSSPPLPSTRSPAAAHRASAPQARLSAGRPSTTSISRPCLSKARITTLSAINKRLDGSLKAFCERKLKEPFLYLILDARYERVREDGITARDWEGRRQVLAVLPTGRAVELERVFGRPACVEFVVSGDHPGLKKAIAEVLAGVFWQRCYVHFRAQRARLCAAHGRDDCLLELRWMSDRRDLGEMRRDLAAWPGKWGGKYPKLTGWVEDNIEETFTYFRLLVVHRKQMRSTNMLERLNEEIRRRTHVVRIFLNTESLAQGPSLSRRRRRSPALRFWASERRRLRGDGSAGPQDQFCWN